jgi:hypothetical protein
LRFAESLINGVVEAPGPFKKPVFLVSIWLKRMFSNISGEMLFTDGTPHVL